MKITGSFVIFGSARAPGIALLTKDGLEAFYDGLRIARDRARDPEAARLLVLSQAFGRGVEIALPAWSQECMEKIAQEYAGPFQVEVRGMCAAIALGRPTNNAPDLTEKRDPEGGEKEPRRPVKPRKGGPSGAFFEVPAESSKVGL